MEDTTPRIIELLTFWQQYVQSNQPPDLKLFTGWLHHQLHAQRLVNLYQADIAQFIPSSEEDDAVNAQLSMLWGQLDNYRALLFKHALKALDLNGIDEYTLLLFVELHHNPSKKDFVQSSPLEPTTSFEMIKRLQRKGFLTEQINPKDRRSTLIEITPEGSQRLEQAKRRLMSVNRLLYAGLAPTEKPALVEKLHQMIADVTRALRLAENNEIG